MLLLALKLAAIKRADAVQMPHLLPRKAAIATQESRKV